MTMNNITSTMETRIYAMGGVIQMVKLISSYTTYCSSFVDRQKSHLTSNHLVEATIAAIIYP